MPSTPKTPSGPVPERPLDPPISLPGDAPAPPPRPDLPGLPPVSSPEPDAENG